MDIQNITRSYAARLLGYRDANKAARELFDIVEAVIHDDKEYSKTKDFVLQIIQVIHAIAVGRRFESYSGCHIKRKKII